MRFSETGRRVVAGLAGLVLLVSARAASADHTYFALGDSLAFGTGRDQTAADVSNGDRGYVYALGNLLTDPATGQRPAVVNLAIPGETSSSFFGTGPNYTSPFAYMLNTNYPTANPPTQRDFVMTKIAAELAANHTIDAVSIQLGANDLFALATSPAFQSADDAGRLQLMTEAFNNYATNVGTLLGTLRAVLPGTTKLALIGYYDPFAPYFNSPTDPRFPFARFAHDAIPALNGVMANLALATPNTSFIDVYPLFVGKETTLTYVADPDANVHPTPAGYATIASGLTAVPEPSSFVLMGLGAAGTLVLAVKRRRSTR